MTTTFQVICAWCNELIDEKAGKGAIRESHLQLGAVHVASHSICQKCVLKYFPHLYEKLFGQRR